jgi:ferredoxin
MKAKVDPELCSGTGLCEETCPEVFILSNGLSTVKVDQVPPEAVDSCRAAAQDCPTQAISIEQ